MVRDGRQLPLRIKVIRMQRLIGFNYYHYTRCTGVGISSASSRLGMILGTWLVEEGHFFERTESKAVAGVLAVASGALALLQLPETTGKPMVEIVRQERGEGEGGEESGAGQQE